MRILVLGGTEFTGPFVVHELLRRSELGYAEVVDADEALRRPVAWERAAPASSATARS